MKTKASDGGVRRKVGRVTAAEAARLAAKRRAIVAEFPPRAISDLGTPVGVVRTLKEGRLAAELTIAEISRRSGMAVATLRRLEDGADSNPTADTLARDAAALGMRLEVHLLPARERPKRSKSSV
jgi:hypothetical protein